MSTPTPETKQVALTVDGKPVQVPAGSTVFQAAQKAGIFIPHYCYHPDLSIAGVCRMCVVDVEKIPRLQISCNTPVTEGMVVKTNTDRVRTAVKACLELHLINHPLDCPICDKAGECKLQDFYAGYGLYPSQMDYEKVHKPKVVDIGTIVLDSERCILCTRCVRFTDEVTRTHELRIFNRGDRSELKTYDGGPLRNHYTGNLADICPVGALTAKDFRFQQRVWFLDKTDSVCTLCARGCNTQVSYNPRTKRLFRVEPRRNPDVNRSWICDTGRWGYHFVYSEKRLRTPLMRHEGALTEAPWEAAFRRLSAAIADAPEAVLVGLSSQLTNEEVAEAALGLGKLGVKHFGRVAEDKVVGETEPFDGVLRHRDPTPNAAGVERTLAALGVPMLDSASARKLLSGGTVRWLFLFGMEGEAMSFCDPWLENLPSDVSLVVHATSQLPLWERAEWLLPAASAFERAGTMVNALGRLQRLQAAIPRVHLARSAHDVVHGIGQGNDRTPTPLNRHRQVFEKVVAPRLVGKEMTFAAVDPMGLRSAEGVKR